MRSRKRRGVSLLEVVIGAVVMAVIAGTVTVNIKKMKDAAKFKLDKQNVKRLEAACAAYQLEYGGWPDYWLTYLYRSGYSNSYYQNTPFGGYYNHQGNGRVYNRYSPGGRWKN